MKEAFHGTKYEHCKVRLVGAEAASRTEETDDLKDNNLIRDPLTLDESYGTESCIKSGPVRRFLLQ
jgi:hypothetical protein